MKPYLPFMAYLLILSAVVSSRPISSDVAFASGAGVLSVGLISRAMLANTALNYALKQAFWSNILKGIVRELDPKVKERVASSIQKSVEASREAAAKGVKDDPGSLGHIKVESGRNT